MGHSGELAQTYAKASDEFRRAAIDEFEAFVLASSEEVTTTQH